jgi:DNA-binding response OmpR family regulator
MISLGSGTPILAAGTVRPMTGDIGGVQCGTLHLEDRTASSETHVPLRLLVVDDHAPCAESLAVLLRLWGADVRVCRNGIQAIDIALAFRPDAALLDIMLPGMDGYQLAGRFRGHNELKHMMLIAVTGLGDLPHRTRTRETGFAHHLLKPLIHEELRKIVRVLLHNRSDA